MIKLNTPFFQFVGAAFATLLLPASVLAATISFEAPGYSEGTLNSTQSQPVSFDPANQDGWSNSTSTMNGVIAPNSANGLSGSGQFLTIPTPPNPASAYTMIAAKQTPIAATGVTSISFDLRFVTHDVTNVGGGTQNMAGFAQTFPDGDKFSNSNAGIQFGQTGPTSFGYRVAGFGGTTSVFAPSFDEVAPQWNIPAPQVGNWYGITATIAEEVGGNRDVTLSLFDHASQTIWRTETVTIAAASFGSVAPEDSDGVFVRLTRHLADDQHAGAVDNLNFTVIPEPSTYAFILGFIGLAFVTVRRVRKG